MGHGENNTKKEMNFKFNAEHTFFTSDTHFNHANIIKFCNRPFKDVEQMNDVMIANWNSVIGKDDTVFHMGNHDLKNIRQGFISRFEHVAMQMRIEIGKKRIYLCHYPFLCFEGGYKDDVWQLFGHVHTRRSNSGIDVGRLQYLYPTQYDVGVDNNNFTPVSFGQVKRIIDKQVEQSKEK